jgi:hypothetical protein
VGSICKELAQGKSAGLFSDLDFPAYVNASLIEAKMRSIISAVFLTTALVAAVSSETFAQESEKDSSGTNPAVLSRSIGLSNDTKFFTDGSYYNTSSFKFTQPFNDGKMSLRLNLPVINTDLVGDNDIGFGDVGVKWTWVPHVDKKIGVIVSGEIVAPTASGGLFGSGKWTVAPGLTVAKFFSKEVIIAGAVIHTISFAGDDSRTDINRTDFDLYTVYKPAGKKWWLTGDLAAGYDYELKKAPASVKVALGFFVTKLQSGGVINGSIRPGVGIGNDRSFDYSLEVGLTLVNF